VRIRPSNDGLVTFDAVVMRGRPGDVLSATISRGDTTVASAEAPVSGSTTRLASIVPGPLLWAVGRPNLYEVTFEVRRGTAVLDRVRSYYGYRSVSASQGRVLINNRPTYLKMVLDQGYWPQSGLTPPSDEAIQADIEATLAMGFNGARKHQKVEDPRYLYWADRKGFLVSAEIGNAYVFDEQYAARFTREWMEVVARDANHPSVIMWIPINESWGTPDLSVLQQQQHLKSLYALTKSLDPSRLVTDNDGWEHLDTTDLFGLHDYARTGSELLERYRDLGKPSAPVPANARSALAPGFTYNGAPFWLSEFGGIAYIAPTSNVPKDAWGYSGVEPDQAAALARLRGLYEALAKLPAFAGICYTQLTDVEQEMNGLLTYDRKPKFDSKRLKEFNDRLR
jgi:ribulose bisphosphate carboxylase small subunit